MFNREFLTLLVVALVAWFLRVGFAIDYAHSHPWAERPVIDEASYEDWSIEIARGEWLGDEVFFQEPLYPYALAVVHAVSNRRDEAGELLPNRTGVRHLQAFLGGLGVLLVGLLALRVFGFVPAVLAASLGALYLPWLHVANLFLKPNLVLPLVAAIALVVLSKDDRKRRWIGLGVLAGLGALLRGNLLLMLPLFVLCPFALGGSRTLRSSAFVVLGTALVLVPVAVRNLVVGDVFALSTSGAGTNLYGGNNEHNPWGRATEFPWVRGIPAFEAEDWRREAERRTGASASMDRGEVSSFWLGETLRSIGERPGMHLAILARKAWLVLGRYEVPDNHSLDWDRDHVASLRWPLVGWGTLLALGLVGVVSLWRRRKDGSFDGRWVLVLGGLFVAYVGTIVLTVVSGRIRLALVPWLLPFAGVGVEALVVAVRTGLGRVPVFATFVLASGFAYVANVTPEVREEDWHKKQFNHVVYLASEPEFEGEALQLALDLEARFPGSSRVLTLVADLEARRGFEALDAGDATRGQALLQSALDRLRTVVKAQGVAPREVFRAHAVAGHVQWRLGRADVAERRFESALRFDPDDRELRLAWLRARARRVSEASGEAKDALESELRVRADLWDLPLPAEGR